MSAELKSQKTRFVLLLIACLLRSLFQTNQSLLSFLLLGKLLLISGSNTCNINSSRVVKRFPIHLDPIEKTSICQMKIKAGMLQASNPPYNNIEQL